MQKIFLFASVSARASRRFIQLQNIQDGDTLAQVISQLVERDTRDSARAHSPLMPAEEAVQIDTTSLSIDQVFASVLNLVHMHG